MCQFCVVTLCHTRDRVVVNARFNLFNNNYLWEHVYFL